MSAESFWGIDRLLLKEGRDRGLIRRTYPVQEPPLRALEEYLDYKDSVQSGAVFKLLEAGTDRDEFRAITQPYFIHFARDYIQLIHYLWDHGYEVVSLSRSRNEPAKFFHKNRICFLNFDVHIRDLFPLLGLLDVNLSMGVRSTSFLFWDFSMQERGYARRYQSARNMFSDGSQDFGFHSSPVDSALIWKQFDGDPTKYTAWTRSMDGRDYFARVINDSSKSQELFRLSEEVFSQQFESFNKEVGECSYVNSHGGAFDSFLHKCAEIKEKGRPDFYVTPQTPEQHAWLKLWNDRLNAKLIAHSCEKTVEWTNFIHSKGLRIVSDGVSSPSVFSQNIESAIKEGVAINLLLHPHRFLSGYHRLSSHYLRKAARVKRLGKSEHRDEVPKAIKFNWLQGVSDTAQITEGFLLVESLHADLSKNNIKGAPCVLDLGSFIRIFSFDHDDIPEGAMLKVWIMDCDAHGRGGKNLRRSISLKGVNSQVEHIPTSSTTPFRILIQHKGLPENWKISKNCTVQCFQISDIAS